MKEKLSFRRWLKETKILMFPIWVLAIVVPISNSLKSDYGTGDMFVDMVGGIIFSLVCLYIWYLLTRNRKIIK